MANMKVLLKGNRKKGSDYGEGGKRIARTRDLTRIINILSSYPNDKFRRIDFRDKFGLAATNLNDSLLFLSNHKVIIETTSNASKWQGNGCKLYQINKEYLKLLKK